MFTVTEMANLSSPPTLRDVAAKAGVSHMTVSRVVRGVRAVAPATLARVQAAIVALGYRPDPAMSALAWRRVPAARPRAWTVAFLDCDGTAYARAVAAAAAEEAGALGYRLETHRLPSLPASRRRLRGILHHRGIAGLLLGPAAAPLDLGDWNWEGFAVVSLGILAHEPGFHAVGMDYHEGMMTALAALACRGEIRPGFCLRRELNERTGRRWLGAYLAAQPGPAPLIFENAGDLSVALVPWARRERVKVVLTADAVHAVAFRRAGLRVAYLNQHEVPAGCAHIALDAEPIGVEGVRMLHHLLSRREFGVPALPKVTGLRGRWVNDRARSTRV